MSLVNIFLNQPRRYIVLILQPRFILIIGLNFGKGVTQSVLVRRT